MGTSQIEIKPSSDPSILKFEVDRFLSRHDSYKYTNVIETRNSPLAQQLLHLPYVKAIYIAQNFVGVEKKPTVEWKEVREEIARKIQEYVDSGKQVVRESKKNTKNLPITVYVEATRKPEVMKFVSNKKLVLKPVEFKEREKAEGAPLVERLFLFPYVEAVFLEENFVSITKNNMAGWEEITLELREFIREFLKSGGAAINEDSEE